MFCLPLGYHALFEIVESRRPSCPPEIMQILVPKGDPVFQNNSTQEIRLHFQRAQWDQSSGQSPNNPRIQVT